MRMLCRFVLVFTIAALLAAMPAAAAPPYTANTSGTTQDGVLAALTDLNTAAAPGVIITSASTNCIGLKSSAGTLFSLTASSTPNAANFIKIYDVAGTPSATANTAKLIAGIPSGASGVNVPNQVPPIGMAFANGIGICVTGAYPQGDNSNALAGAQINYSFK
jgi:hypothetical protein